MFSCDTCHSTFVSRRNLQMHCKVLHKTDVPLLLQGTFNKYLNKCILGCEISFCYIKNLIIHLQNEHNIIINKEEWVFASFDEFSNWLEQVAINEKCSYFQKTSPRKIKDKTIIYLHCSYSGYHQTRKRPAKTKNREARGTKKLNFSCTNHMIATIWPNKTISVVYWKDHYGHLENLEVINLTKLEAIRNYINHNNSKNNITIGCLKRIRSFKQQTVAIKENFAKTLLNVRCLNDHQLNNIYRKSVYLKKYSKEIVIHRSFGIQKTKYNLKVRKDTETAIQLSTRNLNDLNEFLVFKK